MEFSILDDGRPTSFSAGEAHLTEAGRLSISAASLEKKLGWSLKPQGLCQGNLCIPVSAGAGLTDGDDIDFIRFGELLGRPTVVDAETGVAAIGRGANSQIATMTSLEAPDFELPDLAGERHTLSAHRGKKVLLIAYASW
jgi:hypothetical protein